MLSPPRPRQYSVTESSVTLPPDCGSAVVAEYRAYLVGIDGHFIGFEPLVCTDDTEATELAERLVDGHEIELWSGPRFVTKLVDCV